ncbi:flagellar basal body rod C-terminal domain-containing protein, partial [Pseudomonas aeruginosa]
INSAAIVSDDQRCGVVADMMSASRDFETNVDVLNNVKSMQQSLLKLGEA